MVDNRYGTVSENTPTEGDGEGCQDVPEQWPVSGQIQLSCVSAVYKSVLIVYISVYDDN